MKKNFSAYAMSLLMLLLTSCSMADDEDTKDKNDNIVNVGNPLPTFTIIVNNGTHLSTSDLIGKPSVIIFFSTTCPDCQHQLPELNRRYLAHGNDTTFIAISREQGEADVAAYWKENYLSLPYSAQKDRTIYSLFARKGIPRIYIADAKGIVKEIIQ